MYIKKKNQNFALFKYVFRFETATSKGDDLSRHELQPWSAFGNVSIVCPAPSCVNRNSCVLMRVVWRPDRGPLRERRRPRRSVGNRLVCTRNSWRTLRDHEGARRRRWPLLSRRRRLLARPVSPRTLSLAGAFDRHVYKLFKRIYLNNIRRYSSGTAGRRRSRVFELAV